MKNNSSTKKCELNLNANSYSYLSPSCRDLLSKMLQKEPEKRIQAADVLQHPYFSEEAEKINIAFPVN
jgi:serine/threonine protein kinase